MGTEHEVSLWKRPDLQIDYFRSITGNRRLAFTFTPSGNKNILGTGYAGRFLLKNGFDVVAFKSNEDKWYQNVPAEIFDAIAAAIEPFNYERRVAYGSSMGAHASILFSQFLRCDIVLACSPQFSIDDPRDTRWASWFDKTNWQYRLGAQHINANCKYFVLYGKHDADELHFDKLASIIPAEQLTGICIPNAGHPAITYISEVKMLKPFALSIFQNCSIEGLDLRANRRQSKSFFLNLARALHQRRKFRFALFAVDSALKLDPDVVDAYRLKIELLSLCERLDEAITLADRTAERHPEHASLQSQRARLLHKRGLTARAMSAVDASLNADPKASGALRLKIELLDVQGRTADALALSEKTAELAPNDAAVTIQRAQLLQKLGRTDESLRVVDAAIKLQPTSVQFQRFRIELLDKLDRVSDAVAQARISAGNQPGDARLQAQLAQLLHKQGEFNQALDAVNAALAIEPASTAFRRFKFDVLEKLDRNDEALALARQYTEENPKDPDSFAQLAQLLGRRKVVLEAIAAIDKAIALRPGDMVYCRFKVDILRGMGKVNDAIQFARKAARESPQDARFKGLLSLLLSKQRLYEEAIYTIESAIELDPDVLTYHLQLIELLHDSGSKDSALDYAKRVEEGLGQSQQLSDLIDKIKGVKGANARTSSRGAEPNESSGFLGKLRRIFRRSSAEA